MVDTTNPPIQNPLNLVGFLLVEFGRLQCIEQVYEKLGGAAFRDISSDSDAAEEWATLGLTAHETPYLLSFDGGLGNGEMEFIFSDGRLVQAGLQLLGGPAQADPLLRLYEAIRSIIGLHFHVMPVSPTHIMFSDNELNGYLHLPGGVSVAVRLAELRWCEAMYGPLSRTPL